MNSPETKKKNTMFKINKYNNTIKVLLKLIFFPNDKTKSLEGM